MNHVQQANSPHRPGVAQAAIQEGRYVGRLIAKELKGRKVKRPFRYFDKGNMAVVGKNYAVLDFAAPDQLSLWKDQRGVLRPREGRMKLQLSAEKREHSIWRKIGE
jgi:NADH dehydrogenase FAD-containing subunit